ncbi:MAG: hypothetical protein H6591_00660 [Flavobacteriales bacterium]|nr:hypothetical protein [Flavobacteriales bacterium]
MLRTISLALMLAACVGRQKVVDRAVGRGTLHLHCTNTAPYCGGADPGPDGMPKPGPWQGMMFLSRVLAE